MYEFHYDYIKNKYGNNSGLLFTDTDSLMYEIKTKYIYEDCSKDKKMSVDSSKYSFNLKYDDSKKLVDSKIKHEMSGVAIEGFVGLKPKMYSF